MIPRLIHQTWKTKAPAEWTAVQRAWVRTWQARNPGWAHQVHDDADAFAFVEQHFPQHLEVYRGFRPVERADLWRCLALSLRGGVYSDFDTHCRVPLDRWLEDDDELVVGLMRDELDDNPGWSPKRKLLSGGAFDPTSRCLDQPVMFTNWTFAARPDHPVVADTIRRITVNATDPYFQQDTGWIVKKTGPGALNDALADYLVAEGSSLEEVARRLRKARAARVGSVRFLDWDAFHHQLVRHYGMRSWSLEGGWRGVWRRVRVALSIPFD